MDVQFLPQFDAAGLRLLFSDQTFRLLYGAFSLNAPKNDAAFIGLKAIAYTPLVGNQKSALSCST